MEPDGGPAPLVRCFQRSILALWSAIGFRWSGKGGLSDVDPREREAIPFSRPETEAATAADIAEIDRLQEILYAQAKYALLVVLQGPDTSGKDGTIRRVFSPINPVGVIATSFKKPTPHELAHDFLWRIHKAVPAAGMIGIFNRWKFSVDDLAERKHWDDYISAYDTALQRCSTNWAPWFIVPADRKWYRNAVLARIVRATLEALDLTYPPEMPELDKIRID